MPSDRSNWTIRRYDSHESLRRDQIRDWQNLPSSARAEAVWEMVVDYSRKHGRPEDELRLQRSVTSVRRP